MDYEQLDRQLSKTADELGIMLLNDFPDADSAIAKVSVRPERFVDAVRHARPKFVYQVSVAFDAKGELDEKLGLDRADETDSTLFKEAPVRDFLRKWKRHNGQTSLWLACFSHEAVLHTCMISPDWRDEFDDAIETLAGHVAELVEALKHSRQSEERIVEPWLLEKAEQLANHPAFNAPRVSREKRGFLAEQLFPEMKSYDRFRVVERATNIAWLKSASTES